MFNQLENDMRGPAIQHVEVVPPLVLSDVAICVLGKDICMLEMSVARALIVSQRQFRSKKSSWWRCIPVGSRD